MFDMEIRKFRELLRIGMSAMKEASELYVKVIDREPAAKQAFRELVPEVPASAWKFLEKVGRGQMHERLLLMGGIVPLGYRSEDRRLVIVPDKADIVRRIFRRYAETQVPNRSRPRTERQGVAQEARQAVDGGDGPQGAAELRLCGKDPPGRRPLSRRARGHR